MKKLLAIPAALLVLVAAALAVGSMRWRPSLRAGPPRLESTARGGGVLLAGAAAVPLDPPVPVPIAGFPRLHWLEDGRRDPVAVRAVVLREPGCSLALVSIEILLVPGRMQRAVERRVRDLALDGVVVAATHTHAGPGGYWDDPLGQRIATGPYQSELFDLLVDRAVKAVREAAAALEPAYLSVARGAVEGLARNRAGGGVDGHLVSARLVGVSGKDIAQLVVYPSHATLLGIDNHRLSGDWPGALMRGRPEPVLFFQGALGDQTPATPNRGAGALDAYARAVSARVASLHYSSPDPWPEVGVAHATAVLPPPIPGASPPLLRRIARNLLYDWVPDRARVTAVRLGPVTFLAVPAEPVAAVGSAWRAAAGDGVEILALAGDYLGYVETSERMAEAAGETVRTYYGPELADRITGAVKLAARAVDDPPGAAHPESFDSGASRLRSGQAESRDQNRMAGPSSGPRASNEK